MYAIGFLELTSIAQGIAAADAILKAANTELIFAHESCPGKYYILFRGETDAVQLALDAGVNVAQHHFVDSIVISNVHPDVIRAINQVSPAPINEALGVMEFFSVTAAIYAADAAVKASNVSIVNMRLGTGMCGKSFVTLSGDVGAVNEAVKAGASHAAAQGMLLASNIIARPSKALLESFY